MWKKLLTIGLAIHLRNWKRRLKTGDEGIPDCSGKEEVTSRESSKEGRVEKAVKEKTLVEPRAPDSAKWKLQLEQATQKLLPRPKPMGTKRVAKTGRDPNIEAVIEGEEPTSTPPRLKLGEEIIDEVVSIPGQPTNAGPNPNSLDWTPRKSKRSKHKQRNVKVDEGVRVMVKKLLQEKSPATEPSTTVEVNNIQLDDRIASLFCTDGNAFRDYTFTKLNVRNHPYGNPVSACFDMGSPISCVDRQLAITYFRKLPMRQMKGEKVNLNGIGEGKTSTSDYKVLPLYMRDINDRVVALVGEFHVTDFLACGILIGNDVIRPNRMETRFACEATKNQDSILYRNHLIPIQTMNIPMTPPLFRKARVVATDLTTIKPGSGAMVAVRVKGTLPPGATAFFIPSKGIGDAALGGYATSAAAIVEGAVTRIPFANFGGTPVTIHPGFVMGKLRPVSLYSNNPQEKRNSALEVLHVQMWKEGTEVKDKTTRVEVMWTDQVLEHAVEEKSPEKGTVADLFDSLARRLGVSGENGVKEDIRPDEEEPGAPFRAGLPFVLEGLEGGEDFDVSKLDIYGEWDESGEWKRRFEDMITSNAPLFRKGLGSFNDEILMPIPFKNGDSDIEGLRQRAYGMSTRDMKAADAILDPLVEGGQVKRVPLGETCPVSSPAFIVWYKGKARLVVDLRKVNLRLYPDAYPLPRQDSILQAMGGCCVFSSMDITKGFFQQKIEEKDKWKTTFITPHRGMERLTVATMGLANSPGFFQHRMERILRPYLWKFALVYIDDVIVYSRNLEDHLRHLADVMGALNGMGITLSPGKCHFAYPSIDSLGHHVSRLGLSTTEEKTAAVRKLAFPNTLKQLETGLGFFGYYRKFVPFYAAIADPLVKIKTLLLTDAPRTGNARAAYTQKSLLTRETIANWDEATAAWEELKVKLTTAPTLAFPDFTKDFILYCDGSKERGYGVALHQVQDVEEGEERERPVLYLSKTLNQHERNYWPTELEMGCLVWACDKLQAFLDEPSTKIIVFTDHWALKWILSLRGDGTAKKNTRLANWALVLHKYAGKMDIRHRPGLEHRNADGLSRLFTDTDVTNAAGKLVANVSAVCVSSGSVDVSSVHVSRNPEHFSPVMYPETLKANMAWMVQQVSIVRMEDELREALREGLESDKHFGALYKDLLSQAKETGIAERNGLKVEEGLLFVMIQDNWLLCIPEVLSETFIKYAHDDHGHNGKNRTWDRLRGIVYMRSMGRKITDYVRSCQPCALSKPRNHAPYGMLQPVLSRSEPFHTISLDFVVGLPRAPKTGYNSFLSITDKFSKAVNIIPGKDTFSAEDWSNCYFTSVYPSWGLPAFFVSDRDAKFTGVFWSTLFKRVGTTLAMTTAYHPSADGQAERTNQTIEITFRVLLCAKKLQETSWTDLIPEVIFVLNTSPNASTTRTPYELLYGVNPRKIALINEPAEETAEDFIQQRMVWRAEAESALVFARARMAMWYDMKRTPMRFEVGESVYVKLAKGINIGYRLHDVNSSKLSSIMAGPFKILRKVGEIAYELELPAESQMHNVISVIHLEPCYNKGSDIIPVKGRTEEEVEKVLGKQLRRGKWMYKVRWNGRSADTWEEAEELLSFAPTKVEEYENGLFVGRRNERRRARR